MTLQTDPQYKLRFSAELREKIKQSAEQNNRSMNAEIISRLEESFRLENKPYKVPLTTDIHGIQGIMPAELGAFIMELAMERAEQIRKEKNK
ncbi:Arc family DNA-binding protein [Moraxella osloensis]|nr:Arc family DNA-binding protein [Moraxella osloensis]QQU05975.1 Arc family DNA-binding protein [Moraxella osloensis]